MKYLFEIQIESNLVLKTVTCFLFNDLFENDTKNPKIKN